MWALCLKMMIDEELQKPLPHLANVLIALCLLFVVIYFIYRAVFGANESRVYLVALIFVGLPFLLLAIPLLKTKSYDPKVGILSPFTLRVFAIIWLIVAGWLIWSGEHIGWGAGVIAGAALGLAKKRENYGSKHRNLFR
jgi:RsiW-degrading membrane proteinase PrsW (M82 family)